MAVCAGIKRSGGRCTVSVESGQTFCHHHDPSRSEERKRAASRAGKSRPSKELVSIKHQLQDLANGVLDGRVDRADGAVAGQLLNILLRALEQERKVRETEDLEERLARLEAQKFTLEGRYG
jgi:hypothetical protein